MRQSKLTLEALLGHPVLDFAYPYGSFNAYDEAQARQLGFEVAASTIGGAWHWASQLMSLDRIRVSGGMSLLGYAYLVGGPAPSASELAMAGGLAASPATSASPATTPAPTTRPSASPSAGAAPSPTPA
jgi:peptidoglycan/xylan/chitin deacetylase (PgdA/CDA1 family)